MPDGRVVEHACRNNEVSALGHRLPFYRRSNERRILDVEKLFGISRDNRIRAAMSGRLVV
jgi:hypothetical protein